jgi:hypothetical protein
MYVPTLRTYAAGVLIGFRASSVWLVGGALVGMT